MFTAAQNAISRHPKLQKVVIMEHAPRFDVFETDPMGIKPKLAKLANSTFDDMWSRSSMKDKIIIGKHSLDRGGNNIAAMYRDSWTGKYDGVHMYSSQGKEAYTRSVLNIIKDQMFQSSSSSSHFSCPQTQYQESQKTSNQQNQQNKNVYTVPVSNQFDILGN
jgi:hypothetical protein